MLVQVGVGCNSCLLHKAAVVEDCNQPVGNWKVERSYQKSWKLEVEMLSGLVAAVVAVVVVVGN